MTTFSVSWLCLSECRESARPLRRDGYEGIFPYENGGEADFVWFRPDGRKAGGSYVRSRGALKRLDPLTRSLCLANGERIPLALLYDVEGEDSPENGY